MRRRLVLAVAVSASVIAGCHREPAREDVSIPIDADDIAGVVRSSAGVEAGVWVIAETDDLGTRFARIVVTDDEGRYVVPDLPAAEYQVWVRGYGLADSVKVAARPGDQIDLIALVAPDAAAAAAVYPAAYWYAMLDLPDPEEVAEIPGGMNNYLMWIKNMGCIGCHQMGQASTRTIPPALSAIDNSERAWARRI
ncbi:MAG: carboxypeptidase-like regulatory domain-containing protein, partial [Woeseiaceae bacterium]|nr:carboxypeptidase-like regulatory domain-containing protein [Woeseiaceae bacterium]